MFCLSAAKVFYNFIQVVVMLLHVLIADSPNLFNDFIFIHFYFPQIKVQAACKFRDTGIQRPARMLGGVPIWKRGYFCAVRYILIIIDPGNSIWCYVRSLI